MASRIYIPQTTEQLTPTNINILARNSIPAIDFVTDLNDERLVEVNAVYCVETETLYRRWSAGVGIANWNYID